MRRARALRSVALLILAFATSAVAAPASASRSRAALHLAPLTRGPYSAPELRRAELPLATCGPGADAPGTWRFLSDLPWREANTGWPAVADMIQPERDVSFSRNPIVLVGQAYDKGLGTFPPSTISYSLEGRYSAFSATAGINDDAPRDAAAVFQVYADGVLVHTTGPVAAHASPATIDLCTAGVQQLDLVVAAAGERGAGRVGFPADAAGAVAVWAGARLFEPAAVDPSAAAAVREQIGRVVEGHHTRAIGELGAYLQVASGELAGSEVVRRAGDGAQTSYGVEGDRAVLANRPLAVLVGTGGQTHARLSVIERRSGRPVVHDAASAIAFASGSLDLSAATVPAGDVTFERVEDRALGGGARLRLPFAARDNADLTGELRVTLLDDRPALTYQVVLAPGWPQPAQAIEYLSAGGAAVVLGEHARAMADAGLVRDARFDGDGQWRSLRLEGAKPAVAWGDALPGSAGSGALVLTVLDETRFPAWLVARRDAGRAAATLGIAQPLRDPDATTGGEAATGTPDDGPLVAPRVYVELAPTADLREALAGYRAVTQAMYPPAALPAWARYQWGSWWTYGSAANEVGLRRQIDTIAESFADLGPWHIIVDAGWQDVGPGGSGDLGRAAAEKYPAGLRALVDYAHQRGVRVVLFLSPVYAHDGTAKGEWLGLPGWIGSHADWFRLLTAPGAQPARYVYDYARPAARDYLADTVRRVVTEHGADGIKIDGLGDVEGHLIPFWERRTVHPSRWAVTPVMDVYRLVWDSARLAKPDAFVESGWANPTTAQPYAHTFRHGDEWTRFDNPYPFPGLAQHFAYAAVQRGLLGQRANVGAPYGGLERPQTREWLGAALALGAHVSLAGDLRVLSPQHLAALRGLLVHYRPFEGVTRTGGGDHGLAPDWSATTLSTPTGDMTFVALVNRDSAPRRLSVALADVGLSDGPAHVALDVESGALSQVAGALTAEVPEQSLRLFVLRRTPGVLWTVSSYDAEPLSTGWRLRLRGPAGVDGRLRFYWPGPAAPTLSLDGHAVAPLTPASAAGAETFSYDSATGVLTLGYYHRGERVLEVTR